MAGGSPQTVGRDGPKHRAIHAAGAPTRLTAPHVPRRARATAAPAATRRPARRARAGPRLGDGDSCSYSSCCTTGTPAPPGALDATARARLLSTPAAAAACYLGAGSTRARHLPGCDNLATTPEALGAPALLPPAPAVAALTSPAALAAAPRVPHRPRVVQRPAYRARGPPCPRASPATPAAAAQVAATPASPAALAVPPHVLQSDRTSRRGAAPRAVAAVTTTCWSAPGSTLMAAYVQSSLSPLVRRLYSTGLSSRAVLPSREVKTVVVPTTSTCRASEHDWCAWINGGRAKDGVSATQCAERLSRP